MKHKIATNLYKICSASRYGTKFPKWETLETDQQDFFRNKAQFLFLTPIRREIEKVENPYPETRNYTAARNGWFECRKKILELLNP